MSQYPQYPLGKRICSKFSSTFVEHQCLPSGSVSVIHPCLKMPLNLKGNLHWVFLSGLSLVVKHWPLGRFPEDIIKGSWDYLVSRSAHMNNQYEYRIYTTIFLFIYFFEVFYKVKVPIEIFNSISKRDQARWQFSRIHDIDFFSLFLHK